MIILTLPPALGFGSVGNNGRSSIFSGPLPRPETRFFDSGASGASRSFGVRVTRRHSGGGNVNRGWLPTTFTRPQPAEGFVVSADTASSGSESLSLSPYATSDMLTETDVTWPKTLCVTAGQTNGSEHTSVRPRKFRRTPDGPLSNCRSRTVRSHYPCPR